MAATYFCFPKKHIPILFHNCDEFGFNTAAILYFNRAASWSWLSCIILPAANIVLGQRGSNDNARPSCSNAFKFSPVLRYNKPKVVKKSVFSGENSKASIYISTAAFQSSNNVITFPNCVNVVSCFSIRLACLKHSTAALYSLNEVKHNALLCYTSQSSGDNLWHSF